MSTMNVGTHYTYIYNMKTKKISTTTGEEDSFTKFFNDEELSETELDELNGFHASEKAGLKDYIIKRFYEPECEVIKERLGYVHEKEEIELSGYIVDAVTSEYYVDGKKELTLYAGIDFTRAELNEFTLAGRTYKDREHKDYNSIDNSISIAPGDVYYLGNGYKFTVGKDHIWCDDYTDNEDENKRVDEFAFVFHQIIEVGNQQAIAYFDNKDSQILMEILKQLGIDTTKEFIINETRFQIKDGHISEVNNMSGVPNTIYNKAIRRYTEERARMSLEDWYGKPYEAKC